MKYEIRKMYSYKLTIFFLNVIVVMIKGDITSKVPFKQFTAKKQYVMLPRPNHFVKKSTEEEIGTYVNEKETVPSVYVSKPGRRMSVADVWSWEHWCELQPKTGNCSDHVERYYYDSQIDQCMNFTFSGCGGNNNNFDTLQKCERFCSGAPYDSLKDDTKYFCELQPDVGICLDLSTKFYYDINEGKCKQFQYGGCGGNRNKFDTMGSCVAECGESSNN